MGQKFCRSPRSRLSASKRDLGTRENFLSHMNAMQLLYSKQGEISLVTEVTCSNRGNFCPNEQAISLFTGPALER